MLITMSDKEIQRLNQVRAAEILNLSTRQITRLLHKLKQDGVSGLIHASRGQPGHRRHDDLLKSKFFLLFLNICLDLDPPWRMKSSAACLP